MQAFGVGDAWSVRKKKMETDVLDIIRSRDEWGIFIGLGLSGKVRWEFEDKEREWDVQEGNESEAVSSSRRERKRTFGGKREWGRGKAERGNPQDILN
jgi:hypothetical protein